MMQPPDNLDGRQKIMGYLDRTVTPTYAGFNNAGLRFALERLFDDDIELALDAYEQDMSEPHVSRLMQRR